MEEIYTHRYTAVSQRNTHEIPQRARHLLRRMPRLLPLVRHPRRRHHRAHRGHCPDHPQKPVLRNPRIPNTPATHRHTRQRIQRSRQLRTRHLYSRNLRTRRLHQRHVQPPRHRRSSTTQNLADAAAEETRRTPPARLQLFKTGRPRSRTGPHRQPHQILPHRSRPANPQRRAAPLRRYRASRNRRRQRATPRRRHARTHQPAPIHHQALCRRVLGQTQRLPRRADRAIPRLSLRIHLNQRQRKPRRHRHPRHSDPRRALRNPRTQNTLGMARRRQTHPHDRPATPTHQRTRQLHLPKPRMRQLHHA